MQIKLLTSFLLAGSFQQELTGLEGRANLIKEIIFKSQKPVSPVFCSVDLGISVQF